MLPTQETAVVQGFSRAVSGRPEGLHYVRSHFCHALFVAAVTLATAMFTGCAVGPKYARPAVEQPPSFKSPAPEGEPVLSEAWWQLYRDAQLDELIATATASNQTIRQAVARVDEARALAHVAA